jgi:hypothetical protein
MSAISRQLLHSYIRSEALGREITGLFGYITAATYLETGPASSSSAGRYQVMVDVTAVTWRRISCDSSITRIIEDEKGEPLSIGRKSRVIPLPMRRALRARDRNCRFPGCTHQHLIDGHHIKHWSKGGDTSLDNLVLLCRHHHRLVHEGGFACEKDQDGKVIFRNQIGRPIDESGYKLPPIRDNVVVYRKEKLEDRHIHSQTCVTKWDGEKMDRDLAVDNLWHLTRSARR